jgi:hypothetical protein
MPEMSKSTGHVVSIDADAIVDEASFHDVFSQALGFPSFYGRNLNAWVDCLSSLDEPAGGLCSVQLVPGELLTLIVDNARSFRERLPDLFAAFLEAAAFVNWRRIKSGEAPVLVLAFDA